jgi:hypothetical protein
MASGQQTSSLTFQPQTELVEEIKPQVWGKGVGGKSPPERRDHMHCCRSVRICLQVRAL